MLRSIALLVAAAALAFGQAAPQPAVSAAASFDCAADGVVVNSITGEPVPRAHLTLMTRPMNSSATGDASGRWSFVNVACGAAPVAVTRPGFLQNVNRPLTLLSGSPVHNVKIELTPQSVFYGRVLDDLGDPVMGAQITILKARVVDGRIRFQRESGSATNDLGEYRNASLGRGRYIVCSNLAGEPARSGDLTVAETCYPGPLEGGAASAMDVPAGRETRVDFVLNKTPDIHVRGTVSGLPKGRGAGLSLVKRGANAGPGGNVGAVNNNTFDFRVAPGSYTLMADYFESGKHLLARVPIEAGTTDIDNVAVTLEAGFTVAGTVAIDSQPEQSAAKPQFLINLRPSEPVTGAGQAKWDAAHGSFQFEEMAPGNYRLGLIPPPSFYIKSATLARQDILNGENSEFSLAPGSGPIEIVLSKGGGSIEGDIVDAEGQPATGGILALRNGRAAIANATGHFKLQDLAPGDYTVYAWDEPSEVAYADADWMRRYGGGGVTTTVAAGQNAQVKLTLQKVPR